MRNSGMVDGWNQNHLEPDDALDHEALELSAIADVRRCEIVVLLVDPLELGEHVRRYEPAAADLIPLHGLVGRALRDQLTFERVVPAADVQLVIEEAVQTLVHVLMERAQLRLGERSTRRGLEVS